MDVSQAYLLLLLILACWRGCVSEFPFQHISKFYWMCDKTGYCNVFVRFRNFKNFQTREFAYMHTVAPFLFLCVYRVYVLTYQEGD